MTQAPTLVISFSGVLSAVYGNHVQPAELDGAFFYLGCAREYVVEEGMSDAQLAERAMPYRYYEDANGAEGTYHAVREAILASEAAGKVAWRDLHEVANWEQLNGLLSSNGLPCIDPCSDEPLFPDSDEFFPLDYSYPEVIDAVKRQQLPYRVITNS